MRIARAALRLAIDTSGGVVALAKALGISSQAVSMWSIVPASRVLAIENICAGAVSRHELRPDFYPRGETDDGRKSA